MKFPLRVQHVATPDFLASKKVIIWCFGARELTQADAWKLVPLTKPQESSL